ncbi:alanine acetyltransferase [Thiopseudomonas alkaliphila]|uniref:[Ribosomal protein bS18]-alanine N-acetyltransferase n=1 Tax=Thiopseudomonas alkaliphila TaxID=1697053 RepID=A0A0K1XEU4_9GAMM|nr:ribosomal protein S18-alanine N-acetyltransferase [Thiopseudomonas alkaliphila]AKX45492.1 alanine acetyltransferase [Thiopseudomonas alkaliphila]AKX46973.1 alanine acetyltransferase [Thiopseudomonas alkaliphila]AKX48794.1 alanine acetyltransferase [Thiopseudomonas alkaliphila]AKX50834.1 alanine acetyltransferase [Thiopseudomonas alkaliphila]AKX53917.1 alanine acetyltransferase [Thiopseudomonas alkaliphila]
MDELSYRPMQPQDLAKVVALEQQAFSHPWSLSLYQDALTSYHCWVLEQQQQHVGHGVIQVILDEAHLLNIAVDKRLQGQGLGSQLLAFLMQQAEQLGATQCFLELRASNQAAYHVYESYGFNEIARRKNYYPAEQGMEDALIMACLLGD